MLKEKQIHMKSIDIIVIKISKPGPNLNEKRKHTKLYFCFIYIGITCNGSYLSFNLLIRSVTKLQQYISGEIYFVNVLLCIVIMQHVLGCIVSNN